MLGGCLVWSPYPLIPASLWFIIEAASRQQCYGVTEAQIVLIGSGQARWLAN